MEMIKTSLISFFFAFIFVFSCSDKSTNPTGELNGLTNPAGGRISKLVIDSRSNFYAGTPAGLEQSTDYGKTWRSLTKSINTVLNVSDIVVTSDNYIFISSYSFNSFSLLRTSDNGTTWTELPMNMLSISSIRKDSDDNIYICGESLQKSTDKGDTWQEIYNDVVYDVCFPNDSIMVIGTTGVFTGQILYSTNDGNYWQPTGYNSDINELYTNNSSVYAASSINNDGISGVLKSFDGGLNWISIGMEQSSIISVISNSSGQALCSTLDGIFLNNGGGINWQKVLADTTVLTFMRDDKNFLYAGTNNGDFLRSTDNGMSWHN